MSDDVSRALLSILAGKSRMDGYAPAPWIVSLVEVALVGLADHDIERERLLRDEYKGDKKLLEEYRSAAQRHVDETIKLRSPGPCGHPLACWVEGRRPSFGSPLPEIAPHCTACASELRAVNEAVAGAYLEAAELARQMWAANSATLPSDFAMEIHALTPADAQATLDRVLAAARLDALQSLKVFSQTAWDDVMDIELDRRIADLRAKAEAKVGT